VVVLTKIIKTSPILFSCKQTVEFWWKQKF